MCLLEKQFSKPTLSGLVADGYSDFYSFSTGRKNVKSLHTIFKMLPRHDPIQMIMNFAQSFYDLSYSTGDKITHDFQLSNSNLPPFVWAIVAKDHLSKIKNGRWDLVSISELHFYEVIIIVKQTFTKVFENSLLGPSYSVLSGSDPYALDFLYIYKLRYAEFADVTDSLLKSGGGVSLIQAFNNASFRDYFLSFSVCNGWIYYKSVINFRFFSDQ